MAEYEDLAQKYNLAPNFTPQPGAVQTEPAGGGVPAQITSRQLGSINPELAALMQQYSGGTDYSKELSEARKQRATQQQAFNQTLEKLTTDQDQGPSKAEMYFRLAAAFGKPTKFGSFGESLGPVAEELGSYQADIRKQRQANKAAKLQVALKQQEMSLEDAKDSEKTLLGLQSENNKDRREYIKGLVKEYIDSGKPASEAGKIAFDILRSKNPEKSPVEITKSPDYGDEVSKQTKLLIEKQMAGITATLAGIQVQQGQLNLATKKEERAASELDPNELKLLMDNKTALRSSESADALLGEALTYTGQAFTKSPSDQALYRKTKATNPTDPRVVATEQLEQILTTSGLAGLRASFGGNPTEGERQVQLLTQGLGATSAESRRKIIDRVRASIKKQAAFYEQSSGDLLSGSYKKKPVTKD
jgi:hypothetical protein